MKHLINSYQIFGFAVFIILLLNVNYTFGNKVKPPLLIIKSFSVNGEERKYDSIKKFKPSENNIQIAFEGIDVQFNGNIYYQYKLHEKSNWDSTMSRQLNFPSLTSGNYTFFLRTRYKNSEWSEPEIILFSIATPFYKYWWFYVCIASLATGLVILLLMRRNKLELQKQADAFKVQQQLNEMENQAKQAMMHPHFIFNALNSIQQYMQVNDKNAANKYLTKFSKLIRTNLEHVSKKYISLEEELEKLRLYLEIEQMRFGEKLQYEILIENDVEEDMIYIPSMILQPFVENAIWHGIMPNNKQGKVQIHISELQQEKMLQIEISDNGIGINQSRKMHKSKEHKSFGTELTIDRILLFSKQYQKTGSVIINDLSDIDTQKSGTLVIINLPIIVKNEHILS